MTAGNGLNHKKGKQCLYTAFPYTSRAIIIPVGISADFWHLQKFAEILVDVPCAFRYNDIKFKNITVNRTEEVFSWNTSIATWRAVSLN